MSGKAKGKVVAKVRERKTKMKKTEKEKRAAQRYAKITDLLVEGKKGDELETAIAEWERETKGRGDKARDRDKPRYTETPQDLLTSTVEQASTSHTRSSLSASPFPVNQPRISTPSSLWARSRLLRCSNVRCQRQRDIDFCILLDIQPLTLRSGTIYYGR
jgi:hypothetical protein